jgi:hypothetical protein
MPVIDTDQGGGIAGPPGSGVCTPWAGEGDMPCVDYDTDPVLVESLLQFSSDVLYAMTGYRWPGLCEETVRPCAQRQVGEEPHWWPVGSTVRGSWGTCTCNRSARCGCTSLSEVVLSNQTVEIVQIVVDGEVVPPVEYRVDDDRYLVGLTKADGSRRDWPCCQRLDLELTEEGTWAVDLIHGGMPPIGGTLSAAALACELLKALEPGAPGCRLPKRVTNITRQGVSMAILDPLTLFAKGQTGLAEVDLWLASVALGPARRRGRLIRPGSRRRTVTRPGT